MKIVICIKQVPGVAEVKIDPQTKQLVRDGVAAVINPFDYHALEAAVTFKERYDAETVALSMGPPRAEDALREALAMGIDHAVLLCDRRFAGSDTWATSYALACAVRRIGNVDLVFCGRQASDGDTAQVGPELAAHLGWAQAANVAACEPNAGTITVKRLLDDGYDCCRLRLPAVIAAVKELNEPRIPTLDGYLRAVAADIPIWDADAVGAAPNRLGLHGSPTRVVRTAPPSRRHQSTKILTVNQLDELIRELDYVSGN